MRVSGSQRILAGGPTIGALSKQSGRVECVAPQDDPRSCSRPAERQCASSPTNHALLGKIDSMPRANETLASTG